jgi:hypothetical protein
MSSITEWWESELEYRTIEIIQHEPKREKNNLKMSLALPR